MTNNSLAIVLAGHGISTDKNIEALLDLNIPEGALSPFTVERITRNQKGLKAALAWFEGEDLAVERVADPIAKLVEYKDKRGWDAQLVMVPDFDNSDDQELIHAAQEAGIVVKDLTGAYDDILPEDQPAANENDGPVESNVKLVAAPFTDAEVTFLKHLVTLISSASPLIDFLKSGTPLVLASLTDEVAAQAKLDKDMEDAPFDGGTQVGSATKKPGTTVMFMNEDGHYRNAEGRRKSSKEIRVWLTDEEIESLPLAIYDPEA